MTAKPSEELSLISSSVTHANARIRLFRIAFGSAVRDHRLSHSEIEAVLGAIYDGGKLDVTWAVDGDSLRAEAKLALLLVMCLETAMPWGGTIRVSQRDNDWTLLAKADRLRLEPDIWAAASNTRARVTISPAQVQFPLAAETAAQLGRMVSVELSESLIQVDF